MAAACRRFPVILDLLATGATNLTNIRRLAGKLTPENHEAILARAVHRTREEIEVLAPRAGPAAGPSELRPEGACPGGRRFAPTALGARACRKGRSACRPPAARRRSPPRLPFLDRSSNLRRRSATTSSSPSARKRTGSSGASRPFCAARSRTATRAPSSIARSTCSWRRSRRRSWAQRRSRGGDRLSVPERITRSPALHGTFRAR